MPKVKKKIVTEGENPTRVTKEEVKVALNNSYVISYNFLQWFLKEAETTRTIKVDANGRKLRKLSARVLRSYTEELVKPLLEMVDDRLILKEELVVALCAAAMMVNQKE